MKLNFLKLALTLSIGCATGLQAQTENGQWRNYFNESVHAQRADFCHNGMSGLRIKGDWSYIKSIRCHSENDAGLKVNQDTPYSGLISENRANTSFVCPPGQVVSGMKCSGEWCDDISLQCGALDPAKLELTSACNWSPPIAGDGVVEFTVPANARLTGIACAGGWCYQNMLQYCEVVPVVADGPNVADLRGEWVNLCSGAQRCSGKVSKSFATSNEAAQTMTSEARSQLAVTISAGFEAFGASMSASTTAGFEAASSEASSLARSSTINEASECGVEIDTEGTDIHAVWQWSVAGMINEHPLVIKTCQVTCTPGGASPRYLPGSDGGTPGLDSDIGACRR